MATALRRYGAVNSQRVEDDFARALDALHEFQGQRLLARYGDGPVLRFFADEMMAGGKLGDLAAEPDAAARRIARLLGDTRSATAAIEFTALSGELDQAMVATLDATPRGPVAYVGAYRKVGRRDDRLRQIELVGFVARQLAGVARNRMSYMAFKLARGPARAAGLVALYDLLAASYTALRAQPEAADRIPEWLASERALVERLLPA